MILWSRADLENWADAILKDYLKEKYEEFAPVDIEGLAKDYLGLDVRYETLSDSLEIYGVSAFQNTVIELERNGRHEQLNIAADTIIFEIALCCDQLETIYRFTFGHEIAHQILRRWENQNLKSQNNNQSAVAFFKKIQNTTAQQMDWNEWQANTLGAALIMPRRLIEECMFRFANNSKLRIYGKDSLDMEGIQLISNIKDFLHVSKTSLLIRLKQLGFVEYKPIEEYYDKMQLERMKWSIWKEQKEFFNRPKQIWKL